MIIDGFIKSLKISPEQEKFLLDDLPKLNEAERLELLGMLKNVYLLNKEEERVSGTVIDAAK